MNILYIGELNFDSICLMRMKALESLGNNITSVDTISEKSILINFLDKINRRISYKFDFGRLNNKILEVFDSNNFDLVWIDKGTKILPETLKKIKYNKPIVKLVHINPDDPFGYFKTGWNNFKKSIPYYDFHFVPRQVNISEYKLVGARNVNLFDFSYDPDIHKPFELTVVEKQKYQCKVGFIGSWAIAREKSIAFLIDKGVQVSVWGNDWKKGVYWNKIKNFHRGPGLNAVEYAKALNGMEIALHFLRRENRDEQTSRTFEIPACGTFMLAERTEKHVEFFKENYEAVFFDNDQELFEKVNYYLHNPDKRKRIAENGFKRAVQSGYSNKERLKLLIEIINNS